MCAYLENIIPHFWGFAPLHSEELVEFDTHYLAGIVGTVLLLWLGHWFKWPRKLRVLESYTYGVTAIYVGIWAWIGWCPMFCQLLAFPLVAGAAVGAAYLYDDYRNAKIKARLTNVRDE